MRLTLIATPSVELTAEQIKALPWLPMKKDNVERMMQCFTPPHIPEVETKLATMRPKPLKRGWYKMTKGGWSAPPIAVCFVTPLGVRVKPGDLNRRDLLRLSISEGLLDADDFMQLASGIYPEWTEPDHPGMYLHVLSHVYRIEPEVAP